MASAQPADPAPTMNALRYAWLAACAAAVAAGAFALATTWSTLAFVPFAPMASSDLYLGDRPGVTSAMLEQRLAASRVVMVGSAADPSATPRLFLVSYLAIPAPLPGITCRPADPSNPDLVIPAPGPLPGDGLYDSWSPPSSAQITSPVGSSRWVAVSHLTPTTWQSYCSP